MTDTTFFDNPTTAGTITESVVEKIKLGEEEYTQDELKKLVGLGKIGLESEEKFKTPLDKVWPTTQKVINENQELRKQLEEIKNAETQKKVNEGQQLSPEEQDRLVREQLKKYKVVFEEDFQSRSREEFAKNQAVANLLGDTAEAIEKYKNDYGIQTQVDDVLKYMDENGLKNPDKAIKLMFEDKIDQVKEQKLKSIKPQGMTTLPTSQAGGKQPEEVKVTKDNLETSLHEFLQGQ